VAAAKSDLAPGSVLDGEGGATVWGKLVPASRSLEMGGLPIGLAHGVRLKNAVAAGLFVTWADVDFDAADEAVKTRRTMEAHFREAFRAAAE
jgi:predicted homoserine dehydrogenase-like protein